MNNLSEMFSFNSKLWFNNRRILKNGDAALYLQVIVSGKHREIPLNLRWPVNLIDLAKGVLLPRSKRDTDVSDYNLLIEMERAKHFEIHRTYRIRNENLDIKKFSREIVVYDHRECFLKYMEMEAKQRYVRKEIDRKTCQNANATRKCIAAYDPDCLFKNIDVKWMRGFKNFMANEGYQPGTIWSRISYTKAYLRLASLEPMLYVNAEVINFQNPKPVHKTTFLDKDELRRLMIIHREGVLTATQQHVLSGFLFTCFTSLRISDLYRVNSTWQINETTLNFLPKKNAKKGKWIQIPMMPMASHYVHHVNGNYFELPTEQEYNRSLKDIAVKANINKKLTSHVGRHTFGYIYMTTVGNIAGLQEILGHTKLETTQRYSHLDTEYQQAAVRKIQNEFSDLVPHKIKSRF